MASPQYTEPVTEQEYLAFEQEAEFRHEFANGEIIAMAGATRKHILISLNTSANLLSQLADRPCEVYPSEMRVQIKASNAYRYPDIAVVCGEREFTDSNETVLINPTVLMEILSPSTASVDHIQKLYEYRQISTLQEYLIIAQDTARVERFMRQDDSTWLYTEVSGLDQEIALPSINCVLALNEIYARVEFDE